MTPKKAIIYDNTCPMCRWYTGEFVKAELLDQENRIAFAELENKGLVMQIDLERSRDEIPLVDLTGGKTLYGLDSLVHLLAPRFPFIPKALSFGPVNWFFRHLYKFVSYNRRVMAPSPKFEQPYDCAPHFNWKYRWMYVLFALSVGWLCIGAFCATFLPAVVNWSIAGLFILLLLPLLAFEREEGMEYLGQVSTVWLIGGLLALPALLMPILVWGIGGVAAAVMVWQALRRGRLLVG